MCQAWAEEEFGHAELGHARRTKRVISMAARLLEQPAGTVSKVFGVDAEREGAYRFLRNDKVDADQLDLARNVACARRMEACGGVSLVAVDKTSLQLSDRTRTRDFGSVGARASEARGVQVITALALDEEGAPLGILKQEIWSRSEEPSPPRRAGHAKRKRVHDTRPPEERESWIWVTILQGLYALAREHAPNVQPWFQIDREGDFWGVHLFAAESGCLSTLRMNRSHAVRDNEDDERSHDMMEWLQRSKVRVWTEMTIPAHDGRPERRARLSIRYRQGMLAIPVPGGRQWVPKWFVYVDEPWPPSPSQKIRWVLATTSPVESDVDATMVIENYTRRWRIEDFHRVWQSGGCNIADSQLQSFATFRIWAILTSSMAARAEHIKHYSREYPDAPATLIFSQEELDTMIEWRHENVPKKKPPYSSGGVPPLQEMTRWVASLGGHMGNRLPGSVVLTRGLHDLALLVQGRRLRRGRGKTRSD